MAPKLPNNTELCSPHRLTSPLSCPFVLLCNFQLSIVLAMRNSSDKRKVLGSCLGATCHSRDKFGSFLLHTAELARQRKHPFSLFWNQCSPSLTVDASNFFSLSSLSERRFQSATSMFCP